MTIPDPVALSQALIRCPSVTPADDGALAVLEAALKPLGFACHRLRFEEAGTAPVDNLYARIGTQGRISASPGTPMWCRRAMRNCGVTIRSAR